jgi:hypothetical protein
LTLFSVKHDFGKLQTQLDTDGTIRDAWAVILLTPNHIIVKIPTCTLTT